jgi:hypothetical protein
MIKLLDMRIFYLVFLNSTVKSINEYKIKYQNEQIKNFKYIIVIPKKNIINKKKLIYFKIKGEEP